jgi:hypothetical protein
VRRLIVWLWIALVAVGVWYAVTYFPRPDAEGPSLAEQPNRSEQPAALTTKPPQASEPTARPVLEALLPLGGTCGARCGVDRWAVKTLTDLDREQVDLTPADATVEELVALQRPAERPNDGRAPPVELTVYRVRGYLGGWSGQADGDIHVVLYGLVNQRVSIVTEIPDPDCSGVCASGLGGLYLEARRRLDAILSRPNPEDRPTVLEIVGVGFWDRREHANGAAANGIELHPVLQLREVLPD